MKNWTFHIITFGCKINQYESQIIREAWKNKGGIETDKAEHAEYICINSCAITAKGERDARSAIYKARKSAPDSKIILTGCAAQFFKDFRPLKNANFERPDFLISQNDKSLLLAGPPFNGFPETDIFQSAITGYNRARPIVKIQDGCSQHCAYCIVPQTRGKPRSRAYSSILEECLHLLEYGHEELVLSGINLRQYGLNKNEEPEFWLLLDKLTRELDKCFSGKYRLRISSIDPAMLTDKAVDFLGSHKQICPQLHLSLQHASPAILKKMGRNHYNPETILQQINKLKKFWPVMGLGADILAGFPGETEEDMEKLEKFIKEINFSYAHVFPFSPRPGTKASQMEGQIDHKTKKHRTGKIRQLLLIGERKFMEGQTRLKECNIVFDQTSHNPHGINEYYCSCQAINPPGKNWPGKIWKAAPLKADKNLLLVEIKNQ